ncbi:MAG: adenosylcobinamide-GDP ribazoletransferase [Prevotella sp.]|nr:adenosylcobinamide-GDP ribazoletransferase [Prevotella sp.]
MRISRNTFDRPWAAFMFFTRLPLWRLHQPRKESYDSVVEWWPLVGWLTGGVMAAVLWWGSMVLPWTVTVLLAIVARLLLTGALHEDGLADFIDGFGGGGTDRQRILDIMKDSHIGTYGVLGLVVYIGLLFAALHSMSPQLAALTVLAADPYAKMLAGQVIQMMPYARTAQTAKAHTVYRRMSTTSALLLAVQGLLPMVIYLWYFSDFVEWEFVIFLPCLAMYFIYRLMWSRLRGYTGDCCGALFLLTELMVYLAVVYQTCRL